jgi:putative membrane protein
MILSFQSLQWFAMYFLSSIALLAGFTFLYIRFTPYNEIDEIKAGKKAPAIALVAAMLGFTIPIITMSFHGAAYADYMAWSIFSGVIQLICFKLIYYLLPKQLEADNTAAGIFYAGCAVCIGIITAFSLIP